MSNEPDDLTVKIYCAMIGSKHIGDFAADGGCKGDDILSMHEAIAIEAKRYAEALRKASQ